MAYKVFISYSVNAKDYPLVTHVANSLWLHRITTFIPDAHARYSENPNRTTAAQIGESDLVIALITSPTARQAATWHELGFALGQEKPAVALVERGVGTEGFLHNVTRVEFDRHDFLDSANSLAAWVRQLKLQKAEDESTRWVAGLVLGGLALWLLNQAGHEKSA